MLEKGEKSSSLDIFQLLAETTEKERKKQREELLAPLGIEEFFVERCIAINKRTCQGVKCKLCIETCPTNALYWSAGARAKPTPRMLGLALGFSAGVMINVSFVELLTKAMDGIGFLHANFAFFVGMWIRSSIILSVTRFAKAASLNRKF